MNLITLCILITLAALVGNPLGKILQSVFGISPDVHQVWVWLVGTIIAFGFNMMMLVIRMRIEKSALQSRLRELKRYRPVTSDLPGEKT